MSSAPTFTAEDSKRLTEVGPETPLGRLFRQHWVPAALSEQLPEPLCDPLPIRLLGEDLVAFRCEDGSVGLIDRYCPHRRADLAMARAEDCGLRCVYHGWKTGPDGKVVDTPAADVRSKRAETASATAYPTREFAGIVWAYLGSDPEPPATPHWPFLDAHPEGVQAYKIAQPHNWLRIIDGEMDAAHAGYLHYSADFYELELQKQYDGNKFLFDPRPSTWVKSQPWGLENILRFGLEDPENSTYWLRQFIAPCFGISGQEQGAADSRNDTDERGNGSRGRFVAFVPSDDRTTSIYLIFWRSDEALSRTELEAYDKGTMSTSGDPSRGYLSTAWTDGVGYQQDRQAMREGRSYSGFDGVVIQDLGVQYGMGTTVDLTKEHLGTEDQIVIAVRRHLLQAMRSLEDGDAVPEVDWSQIQYRWVVAPTGTPYEQISAHPEWATHAGSPSPDWQPAEEAWAPLPRSGRG